MCEFTFKQLNEKYISPHLNFISVHCQIKGFHPNYTDCELLQDYQAKYNYKQVG